MDGMHRSACPRAAYSLALLAALLSGACTQTIAPTRLRIIAGDVAIAEQGVSGTYRVVVAADGLPSLGTGGACLVMRAGAGAPLACETARDCPLAAGLPAGSHAYCLAEQDGTRACWVRPGPQPTYCRLFKDQPIPIDHPIAIPPVPAQPGMWRVAACLNGMVARACGTGGPRQLDAGTARAVVRPGGRTAP